MESDEDSHGHVWTDGSSRKFGDTYVAGVGVYWGPNNPNNFSLAPLPGCIQYIGRAELMAAIYAIRGAIEQGMNIVTVYTDSTYVEQCADSWISLWMAKNWIRADGLLPRNKNELLELLDLMRKIDVRFKHAEGHRDPKNAEADKLATQAVGKVIQQKEQAIKLRELKKAGLVPQESRTRNVPVNSGRPSSMLEALGHQEEAEEVDTNGDAHSEEEEDVFQSESLGMATLFGVDE